MPISTKLVKLDPEWEVLAQVIAPERFKAIYELISGSYSSIDDQAFRRIGLTTREKSALTKTSFFDDFVRSRLLDYFVGTQRPDKMQLMAVKLLLDWKRLESREHKDATIEVE